MVHAKSLCVCEVAQSCLSVSFILMLLLLSRISCVQLFMTL